MDILWSLAVVTSEHLESHQMTNAGNRNGHPRQDLRLICGPCNLGLDSRRSEQKIDDHSTPCFTRGSEPGRRKAVDRVLLDDCENAESAHHQIVNEILRIRITRDLNDKVHVTCGSRFGSRAHREAAN